MGGVRPSYVSSEMVAIFKKLSKEDLQKLSFLVVYKRARGDSYPTVVADSIDAALAKK